MTAATRGKSETGKGRTRARGREGEGKMARADKGTRAKARVDMVHDNSS